MVHCFLDVCGFIPQLNIQSPIGWPRKTVTAGGGASFSAATSGEAAAGDNTHGNGKFRDHDPCSAVENTTTATPEAMIKTTKIRLKKNARAPPMGEAPALNSKTASEIVPKGDAPPVTRKPVPKVFQTPPFLWPKGRCMCARASPILVERNAASRPAVREKPARCRMIAERWDTRPVIAARTPPRTPRFESQSNDAEPQTATNSTGTLRAYNSQRNSGQLIIISGPA